MRNIARVWLNDESVFIETDRGEVRSHPFAWFPRLLNATPDQRKHFVLSPFGIHWPDIDEDLSFDGFFNYSPGDTH